MEERGVSKGEKRIREREGRREANEIRKMQGEKEKIKARSEGIRKMCEWRKWRRDEEKGE